MNKLLLKIRTLSLMFRSRLTRGHKIRSYLKNSPIKKIQIGCGSNVLKGWLNSDIRPISARVVYINAKKPLPLPDCAFDYIYSEHLIEHLDFFYAKKLLEECHRTLKSKGKIRISTPDLEKIIALRRGESDVQKKYIEWSLRFYGKSIQSKLKKNYRAGWPFVLNIIMNGFDHKFVFNFSVLAMMLREIGFQKITRESVAKSEDPTLSNLEGHGKVIGLMQNEVETMVIEATKS